MKARPAWSVEVGYMISSGVSFLLGILFTGLVILDWSLLRAWVWWGLDAVVVLASGLVGIVVVMNLVAWFVRNMIWACLSMWRDPIDP